MTKRVNVPIPILANHEARADGENNSHRLDHPSPWPQKAEVVGPVEVPLDLGDARARRSRFAEIDHESRDEAETHGTIRR